MNHVPDHRRLRHQTADLAAADLSVAAIRRCTAATAGEVSAAIAVEASARVATARS
jgi:hypothetical protein